MACTMVAQSPGFGVKDLGGSYVRLACTASSEGCQFERAGG